MGVSYPVHVVYSNFKTQPYIPSRKEVYVVEHVESYACGKKRKAFKDKKKLSAPGFEPGSPKLKVPRVGKGSSAIKWPTPC